MQKNRIQRYFPEFRHSRTTTQFYEERVWLENTCIPSQPSNILHIFGYGESLFKPRADIQINHPYWAVQWICGGKGSLLWNGTRFGLESGNLFLVPPNTPYAFHIPPNTFLRKKYLVISSGPLISLLCNQGILARQEILHPENSDIPNLFDMIRETVTAASPEQTRRLSNLCYMLLTSLMDQARQRAADGEFETAFADVMSRLAENHTLDSLAKRFHVDKRTLNRLFLKNLNMTPIRCLITKRMEYAKQLLEISSFSIQAIAAECGYRDAAFFSREFKKYCGVSPRAFRKR